jgi:putative membrane protein
MFEHPSVLIGIACLALLYAAVSLWQGRRPGPMQVISFLGALGVILVALVGPIDELEDDRLFTAHMLQHLLLTLVMPPLLLYGVPNWMVGPVLNWRPLDGLARFFTRPLAAFLTFSAVFVVIHHPVLYDLMCRDEAVHITFHLLFMVTATILWWPLLSPLPEFPRLSYPMQVLYIFLLMIPMTAVAAPISLARTVVYPWYEGGTHPFGLSPLEDQVLGGLLMWVGQGIYFMIVFTAVFYRWSRYEDRDAPTLQPAPKPKLRLLHPHRPAGP